ncbi:isocitrate/isopropylmalate dehydrogenase family protein [Patescibacteria group bacterium]|nr:isocitrate/isopropylmalate dehydrogenase family protein [Patescibacteria group bacterium]
MAKHDIAYLPGDGVGVEVLEAVRWCLDALDFSANYNEGDIGWKYWCTEGNALPDRTLKLLKDTECALFGAITSKPKQEADAELDLKLKGKGFSYFSPIVRLRQELNLHTNMRPCKAYPGNLLNYKEGINVVIFRENTEGLYAGIEFHPVPGNVFDALCTHPKAKKFERFGLENLAMSTRLMSRQGCASIVRQAFLFAKKHSRKSVTICDKPNVLRETGGLMIRTAREIHEKEFNDIPMFETNIDAQCMWLVKNPFDYDCIVAENMFGDILSDLSAQLVGGLGFASAGNIGDDYAVFEPTHGSAPKYTGMYKVNPIAAILAASLMLDWLGETEMADRLEKAVAAVIKESKVRTYDMSGTNTTIEMAKAIAAKCKE